MTKNKQPDTMTMVKAIIGKNTSKTNARLQVTFAKIQLLLYVLE